MLPVEAVQWFLADTLSTEVFLALKTWESFQLFRGTRSTWPAVPRVFFRWCKSGMGTRLRWRSGGLAVGRDTASEMAAHWLCTAAWRRVGEALPRLQCQAT